MHAKRAARRSWRSRRRRARNGRRQLDRRRRATTVVAVTGGCDRGPVVRRRVRRNLVSGSRCSALTSTCMVIACPDLAVDRRDRHLVQRCVRRKGRRRSMTKRSDAPSRTRLRPSAHRSPRATGAVAAWHSVKRSHRLAEVQAAFVRQRRSIPVGFRDAMGSPTPGRRRQWAFSQAARSRPRPSPNPESLDAREVADRPFLGTWANLWHPIAAGGFAITPEKSKRREWNEDQSVRGPSGNGLCRA